MQIKVSTNELRNSATKLNNLCNTLSQKKDALQKNATALDNAWDGKASVEAKNQLIKIIGEVEKFSSELSTFASLLVKTATAFEQAEGIQPAGYILKGGFIPIRKIWPIVIPIGGVVRIVPEEVAKIGKQCAAVANEIAALAGNYQSIISSLRSTWEGNSANIFFKEAESVAPNFKYFSELLNTFGDSVIKAAQKYEEIDNNFKLEK